jgi:hypothetical protein
MTADIRNIAFACLAIALAGCAVLLTHDVHSLTGAAHGTLNNVNAATGTLADYARDESTLLRSPKNQAALDAAVQLGGVFNGSGRLLNTQVIPRAMKTLDQLTAWEASLNALTQHADQQSTATFAYVNGHVLPSLDATLDALTGLEQKFNLTAAEATEVIKKSGATADQVNAILASSDPKIQAALQNAADASQQATATLVDFHTDLHATMDQMPTIARDIEKTTRNIAKFSKISIIAGIISNLANGLLPGLLH